MTKTTCRSIRHQGCLLLWLFFLAISCSSERKEIHAAADNPKWLDTIVTALPVQVNSAVGNGSTFILDSLMSFSEAELRSTYGQENVTRGFFVDFETSDSTVTTVLFAGTKKEVSFFWLDSMKTEVESLFVTGLASAWRLGAGVTLGMTVKEVEQLNGGPFMFNGFLSGCWPFQGQISDWRGGTLGQEYAYHHTVTLAFPSAEKWVADLEGTGQFLSSSPAASTADLRVAAIKLRRK